ncbi:putative sam domain-containing protein [Erysiphe neolycopersici]|uniref:Putative sam domain-containing protein n=1 Tax=Erysiphe neolycopersici TaxID=212602 RepID=A0A420I029_9PEZI|nr:putative sam domain-containing protein [Erysiphe neolycopersici]
MGAPEPGHILLVVHDFSARSSDELSLSKGDRVELIERDDDFGDGWFLGRHLLNGKSGLFPEVYTRIAPRGSLICSPASSSVQISSPTIRKTSITSPPHATFIGENKVSTPSESLKISDAPRILATTGSQGILASSNLTNTTPEVTLQSKSISSSINIKGHRQDSPVMNETLSVIDEHITDLKSPHVILDRDRQIHSDSGSEYSSQADQRLSYINGEETDQDEEDVIFTREQVASWTSEEVSEHLFTRGVEPKHCEILKDQEITGDVLLDMDQATIFLKEFDFGSVGRRLKTWQRIKSIQDEVGGDTSLKRNTSNFISEPGEENSRNKSRGANSSNTLPRMSNVHDRQTNSLNPGLSNQNFLWAESTQASPNISKISYEICYSDGDKTRYPIGFQDQYHSRQNSSNQATTNFLGGNLSGSLKPPTLASHDRTHRKRGSFDKNWTMQNSTSSSYSGQPSSLSTAKSTKKSFARCSTDNLFNVKNSTSSIDLLESNYYKSNEVENEVRSISRRRDSLTMNITSQSRRSSLSEEHKLRNSPAQKVHSRFGSIDSIRDAPPHSAAGKYFSIGVANTRRTPSETSISTSSRAYYSKDQSLSASPKIMKLEDNPVRSFDARQDKNDFITSVKSASNGRFGLRAISSAVTGHEKSRAIKPPPELNLYPPLKFSPIHSPPRTGSSTPSGGFSFDLESPDLKGASTHSTLNSNGRIKKKTKKETSAYTRGLEKKKPLEAILNADYSGWMRKKSTNLMASWKPRLFILKGRRLSYYYSEDDEEERGLIDISFHRVLPADNDRLTGLHATLTGATNTKSHSLDHNISTIQTSTESESTPEKGNDSVFIFKLVPPKAGLQRAVTFTKPTIHYFAVPNIKQGRLWMAALMKATIERDETVLLKSTYQQKTISLTKARAMRHRPPALKEDNNVEAIKSTENDENCLDISGIVYHTDPLEGDSGVSDVSNSNSNMQA